MEKKEIDTKKERPEGRAEQGGNYEDIGDQTSGTERPHDKSSPRRTETSKTRKTRKTRDSSRQRDKSLAGTASRYHRQLFDREAKIKSRV